jgi:hypothetical protein
MDRELSAQVVAILWTIDDLKARLVRLLPNPLYRGRQVIKGPDGVYRFLDEDHNKAETE